MGLFGKTTENTKTLQRKVAAQREELRKMQVVRFDNKMIRRQLRQANDKLKLQEEYIKGFKDGMAKDWNDYE